MISVIDYGMGNLRSVTKALELYTDDVEVITDPHQIERTDGLVLPGDGAFAMAMDNLHHRGWVDVLRDYIKSDSPFLGICLGYQLLFSESEEFGQTKGLDIVKGKVVKFSHQSLKVPHMGWNEVSFSGDSQYLKGIDDMSYFYFIHSFYPVVDDESWIVGNSDYGGQFTAVVGKGNVLATQFHPEKSHRSGLKIIENFVSRVCA
jgi:imidazole glycerol-phosphate synthase subunit HisH